MNVLRADRHCIRGGECVSKQTAREILAAIQFDDTWLDFANVIIANAAFFDALISHIVDGQRVRPFFVGLANVDKNIRADLLRSIDALRLTRALPNLGFVHAADGDYELIGHFGYSIISTWKLVKTYGQMTTVKYRELDGGAHAVSTYSTYLNIAYNAHLLMRTDKRGQEGFVYTLPQWEAT